MTRKVKQVAIMPAFDGWSPAIVVVASDGTLWLGDLGDNAEHQTWKPFNPLPQPTPTVGAAE